MNLNVLNICVCTFRLHYLKLDNCKVFLVNKKQMYLFLKIYKQEKIKLDTKLKYPELDFGT